MAPAAKVSAQGSASDDRPTAQSAEQPGDGLHQPGQRRDPEGAPVRYAAFTREYLGRGVFGLIAR